MKGLVQNNASKRYLEGIQQYITDEDDELLSSFIGNKYLKEIIPELSEKDLDLSIKLMCEINSMDCHVLFISRIDSLGDEDIVKATPVIMTYIDCFDRMATNNALITYIGRKGNYQATEFLIDEFKKPNLYSRGGITDDMTDSEKSIRWNSSRRWAVSNALIQIRDKSRLDDYIEFTQNAKTRKDCYLIADLIGHFKCQKSYDCLVDLLSDDDYELQAAALDALRYFYKYDGIEEYVTPFLNSKYVVLREYSKKIMKKIEKNNLKLQQMK